MVSWPLPLLGHGFADAGPYPVSLEVLLLIAGAVVVAAAALPARDVGDDVPPSMAAVGGRTQSVLRVLAIILIVAIVLPAALGPSDVASNPAPRLLFTVGWAGLLVTSALLGPVWSRANPLRWVAGPDGDPRPGMWPAVAGLVLFTFAEQVLEPSPLVVLVVVALYVLAMMAGTTMYGGGWFDAADPLDGASRLLGRLTPLGRTGGGLRRRVVRTGVAATASVPGMAAFLGVLIAASAYDAAAPEGGFGVRLGWFVLAMAAGAGLVTAAARPAYLAAAVLPAAAAHVAAHYLAPLLVDTQVAVVQASDPFGLGWNLLGLTGTEINAEPISPLAGLTISYLLLIAGHALAMVVAKDLAASRGSAHAVNAAVFPVRAVILLSLAVGVFLRMGGG